MGSQDPPRLPLELLRGVIEPLVAATSSVRQTLSYRLVSRAFDSEVLRATAVHGILYRSSDSFTHRRGCIPWHQDVDYDRLDRSLAEFWTTYILTNPHPDEPWDCNIAVLLNRVVDEVIRQQAASCDETCRRSYMRILCDTAILHLACADNAYKHLRMGTKTIGLEKWLKPGRTDLITATPFKQLVAIAQVLVGHLEPLRNLSTLGSDALLEMGLQDYQPDLKPFGSLWSAAFSSGCCDLVREMAEHTAINTMLSVRHRLLAHAIRTRSLDMVKLSMGPPRNPRRLSSRITFQLAVCEAILLQEPEVVRYLLSMADTDKDLPFLVHEGVRAACHTGDNETLRWLLNHGEERNLNSWALDCCVTVTEIAARAGNIETLQIILDYGLDVKGKKIYRGHRNVRERELREFPHYNFPEVHREGYKWQFRSAGSMFWAAVKGRTDIAQMLLKRNIQLHEDEMVIIAMAVVELGNIDFLAWMIDKAVLKPWQGRKCGESNRSWKFPSGKPDLVGHVCVWGTPDMLRMIVERGYALGGTHFAEGHVYTNIMLATLNWCRHDMKEALLSLGVGEADPYESEFRGLWEKGLFPRKAKRRVCAASHVTFYADLAPLYPELKPHPIPLM
ncbi:uncharacterized protein DNG_09206 [Cephalotrichum gorgonifer]|uniref:Uncharacterized protein n=1 Tax=Cephalotrichum gorgonifer TaxID=2041049 RepID=A0AAE8N584_9PEZI|nr:uncharacterized protein DNG_09206 [Cephalotrichum gorgonifer]